MCDIFPAVQSCFLVISVRVAMALIAVLAIMSGGVALSIMEQATNTNFEGMKNVTDIRDPKEVDLRLRTQIIPGGVTAMSVLFMVSGSCLFFAVLSDQEGFVQLFVWITFASVLFGLLLVGAVFYECIFKSVCILSSLDWLSASIAMLVVVVYLFLWLYFIIVANSYVIQIFSP